MQRATCLIWLIIAAATLISAVAAASKDSKKIVCYFGSWAVYRPGNGAIDILDIDPKLCTHLIYTFVGLEENRASIRILDPWADLPNGRDGFNRFNRLREYSPTVKTLVAIGGWNEGSTKYSRLAADAKLRKLFAVNAVSFLRKYGFDGLDIDWEYPNQRGGIPADIDDFVLLLKELREKFDEAGLLLTAALGAAESSAKLSYDIPRVLEYLDFANLMAYDLHGTWDKKTGINAPLYPGSWEANDQRHLNVNASINYWISQGAPREKLCLGVPFYGRTFTLDNYEVRGIGAPASQPGRPGPYTREAGSLGYNEICEMQQQQNEAWKVYYEEEQRVPYTIRGNQWIGYENPRSLAEKADYIKSMDLAGVMLWSIETDDFRGICGEKYPLLKTLNRKLRDGPSLEPSPPPTTITTPPSVGSSSTTQTSTSETSTTQTSTTSKPGGCTVVCKEQVYLRNPCDCSIYYMCLASGQQFEFHCPAGLAFNTEYNVCDWPYNVDCSNFR